MKGIARMNADDSNPTQLLEALAAFTSDQELIKGKAIRVLVTNMLTQLGYLPPVSVGATAEDLVYRSSNGDAWSLATDGAGGFSVTIERTLLQVGWKRPLQ